MYLCHSPTIWRDQFIAQLEKHLVDASTAADPQCIIVQSPHESENDDQESCSTFNNQMVDVEGGKRDQGKPISRSKNQLVEKTTLNPRFFSRLVLGPGHGLLANILHYGLALAWLWLYAMAICYGYHAMWYGIAQ
jgi:hypothetical protein